MNDDIDTAWLSKETDDFLLAARIWPAIMTKLFHVVALALVVLITHGWYALYSHQKYMLVLPLVGLVWIAYKLSQYKFEITLIDNEMKRRTTENKDEIR